MSPEVAIGLYESETHHAIAKVLTDWSKNQLIREFIICWTTPEVHFERVADGQVTTTRLASELDVGEKIILLNLAAWMTGEEAGLSGELETSLAARSTILDILSSAQSLVREPIVLLAPPTLDAKVPHTCLREGRRTLVLSPEEREAPAGTNHLVENPDVFHAHVAAAVASLAGLWTGTEDLELPLLRSDPHTANGALARTVSAYTRIVDVGYLADHVAKHTLQPLAGWPNPSPAEFDSLDHDESLLADLTSRYLARYRDVLGPTQVPLLEVTETPKTSLLQAWLNFFRDIWAAIKFKPVEIAEKLVKGAYTWAQKRTESITGYKVPDWDDPEPPLVLMQAKAEERYRTADGEVRGAWWDLRQLCISMIDGSELPEWVPTTRVIVDADRRLLVLDPNGYVPDPNVPAPLTGISPCDPRALDPECGRDLSQLTPDTAAEVEAFVERRRNSVLWRVGVTLANNIHTISDEAVSAEEEVQKLRQQAAEQQEQTEKKAKSLAKSIRRFLLTSLLLALAAIGGAIAVAETQKALVTVIACIALPIVWLLVSAILATRLVRRRRKFEDETTSTIVELSNQAVRAGIRRADVDRLERRYKEYLDWGDILGWLLHEPWSPPEAPDTPPTIDRSLTLPASVQRGVAQISPATLVQLEASAKAAVFPKSWLDQVASEQQEHSARTYLAVRENVPDPDAIGRALPDPFGDTRLGDGTPRKFYRAAVRDLSRRRELGEAEIAHVEDDLREHWAADRIIGGVLPPSAENAVTTLAPGWEKEPPKLQELAPRISPSVVQIRCETWGGSGVVIGPGRVLTNAHVVGFKTGTVDLYLAGDWKAVTGTVEKVSNTTDLALVQFAEQATKPPAVPLAPSRPGQGATVFTIGYPFLLEGDPTLSWGYVSAAHRSITLDKDDGTSWRLDVLQSSYASGGGASGSGVFDAAGALVGVHCAGRVRDERADEFMSYAVPVDLVREFLGAAEETAGDLGPAAVPVSAKSAPAELLADFLGEISVDLGAPVFGSHGPWRPGSSSPAERVEAADVVFGADQLDPRSAQLDARHGRFSVFVRSVTALSGTRHAGELKV